VNSTNYEDMIAELRSDYLESFDEKFSLMKSYAASQEWYSLELELHKLKGTGSTYGAPEVTELCQVMEARCREQGSVPAADLTVTIELLEEIRKKYTVGTPFELTSDPRFVGLKKI
jgi:HPt (histidine-containing phosphotransfer) domain-containing protein